MADPYPAFKEGGQSFMADSIHPNDAGHAAIEEAFGEASAVCPEADKLPLPTPPPPPSNAFSFGKVTKNKKRGTARLAVNVPGPGGLDLAKTKKVNGYSDWTEAAGKHKLPIKPRRNARKRLASKGKAKVRADVTYTPDGGEPNTQSKKIKLIKAVGPRSRRAVGVVGRRVLVSRYLLLGYAMPERDTARAMPAAESEVLRAFRERFEQGNRAWNAGDVKTAYPSSPISLSIDWRRPGPRRGCCGAGTR